MMPRSCNPRVISSYNVDFKTLLLNLGVFVVTLLGSYVGILPIVTELSASSPSSSSSCLCSRAIANTLWGSAFAFFSLMADRWPAHKAETSLWVEGYSLGTRLISFFVVATVTPLYGIYEVLRNLSMTLRFRQIITSSINPELAADTTSMFNKFRRHVDGILVIMFGIKQPRGFLKNTRMAANTHIVLGISHPSTFPSSHRERSDSQVQEENMADALTLGHKTAVNSFLLELNEAGKLALLESSILPDYKQLRFLDGRSGIATLVICVQAIGYVTSIVYRAIHHLPVSPIEAIGFSFSMSVIVHSLSHSLGAPSQCPLVLYLNHTQEQQMIGKCNSIRWSNADELNCGKMGMLGTVVVGSVSVLVVLAVFLFSQVLNGSSLDIIGPFLFVYSLMMIQSLALVKSLARSWKVWASDHVWHHMWAACAMASFGGIVVSIVATILNWHTSNFDSRTPSVIHNLPFIG